MRAKHAVLGVVFTAAGAWLLWDYVNAFINWVAAKNWTEFCTDWHFQLPFQLYTFSCWEWSLPFDLGLSLIAIGFIIIYKASRVF